MRSRLEQAKVLIDFACMIVADKPVTTGSTWLDSQQISPTHHPGEGRGLRGSQGSARRHACIIETPSVTT
jgi:hypothetical protein